MYYSKEFNKLINNKRILGNLLTGSGVESDHFDTWKNIRFPIVQAINKNGSFLDVGCANGFLLRCLKEWSNYKLELYGVDSNLDRIRSAKELFAHQPERFIMCNICSPNDLRQYGFLANFDFVYWNVWDNLEFKDNREINIFFKLYGMVSKNGRIILGFYDSDKNKHKKIKKLERSGIKFSGKIINPTEIFAWVDKN